MGLFDYFIGKPERFEKPQPTPLLKLQAALVTLGAPANEPPTVSTVAKGASALAMEVNQRSRTAKSDAANYVGGILTMVAANHFSRIAAVDFEQSSAIGVMMFSQLEPRAAGEFAARIIDGYNDLATRSPDAVQGIGERVAAWSSDPSETNLDGLTFVYGRLVKASLKTKDDRDPKDKLAAALENIGWKDMDLNDARHLGAAAGILVKGLFDLAELDPSPVRAQQYGAMMAVVAAERFIDIQGGKFDVAAYQALEALFGREFASTKLGAALAVYRNTEAQPDSIPGHIRVELDNWIDDPSGANLEELWIMLTAMVRGPAG
jgi:hypothetical protein